MGDIIRHGAVRVFYMAQLAAGKLRVWDGMVEHNRLDFLLQIVGQLIAVHAEYLDSIEFKWIMRRGNHNTRVGIVLFNKISDRRRRHDAEQQNVCADGAKPRDERAFNHV